MGANKVNIKYYIRGLWSWNLSVFDISIIRKFLDLGPFSKEGTALLHISTKIFSKRFPGTFCRVSFLFCCVSLGTPRCFLYSSHCILIAGAISSLTSGSLFCSPSYLYCSSTQHNAHRVLQGLGISSQSSHVQWSILKFMFL